MICLTGNTVPWMPSGDTSIFCSLPLGIFIMSSMVMLIGAKYISGKWGYLVDSLDAADFFVLVCFVVWRDSTTNMIMLLLWFNLFMNPSVTTPWVISGWCTENSVFSPSLCCSLAQINSKCTGSLCVNYLTSSSKISQSTKFHKSSFVWESGIKKTCNLWGNDGRCLAVLFRSLVLHATHFRKFMMHYGTL